jgi:hypothetical protein
MTSISRTVKTLQTPAYQFISHGLVHALLPYLQIMRMPLWYEYLSSAVDLNTCWDYSSLSVPLYMGQSVLR